MGFGLVLGPCVARAATLAVLAGGCVACTSNSARPDSAPYTLPAVSSADAAGTVRYLSGAGAPLMTLHRSAAALVSGYTAEGCRSLVTSVTKPTTDLTSAALTGPDPVLSELSLDEIHAVVAMSDCPQGNPTTQLAGVVRLFDKRLQQVGAS